jgi:hypothetical protein
MKNGMSFSPASRRSENNGIRIMAILLLVFLFPLCAGALEISGYFEGEARLFAEEPLYPGQEESTTSFALEPEIYHEFSSGLAFTFTPFARIDSVDENRTHYDIRELFFIAYGDWWEARAGIDKVFWGQAESVHLVDIVNQTDMLESFDTEDKLGQPLVKLSILGGSGSLDIFLLPYFREGLYPGKSGRLRSETIIDADLAEFENGDKERHLDYAFRFRYATGDLEFGLSRFIGTSREASLKPVVDDYGIPVIDADGSLTLYPYYEQIGQTGIDLLYVRGASIWKLESIFRTGQVDMNGAEVDYGAAVGGLEYTFYGVAGSATDVGILAELIFDERGDDATTPMNHDVMIGSRFALNDVAGTALLAGLIYDYENEASILTLEGSRRFTDHWKGEAQAFYFLKTTEEELTWQVRDDSYIELKLFYYY